MALRIKSRWHTSDRDGNITTDKSLEDHAGAMAFIMWRVALDKAVNLHGEDYVYTSDGQRIAVICEYLAFELQVLDRLAFLRDDLNEADRELIVTTTAKRVSDHVQDNASDLFGEYDYRGGFLSTLNERSGDYAEYSFTRAGPSYSFLRYLGHKCQNILAKNDTHMNRWVIDQVMEKDAPDTVEKVTSAFEDLME